MLLVFFHDCKAPARLHATDPYAHVLFPTSPWETPSQPPHVALHSLLPAPPKPTSGAAYRARRHLGLQLEGIKGSGGGRGVFLVLGMFWVSSYSSGPVLWMCGARGDCHAHWWDLQSCYQNLDFKWATVCGGLLCAFLLYVLYVFLNGAASQVDGLSSHFSSLFKLILNWIWSTFRLLFIF